MLRMTPSICAMMAVALHFKERNVMTFSIVAYDPQAEAWGVAVQSKFVAIGALTPWAKAGVGVIATQAWINSTYGSRGLELLAQGLSPTEAIRYLNLSMIGRALQAGFARCSAQSTFLAKHMRLSHQARWPTPRGKNSLTGRSRPASERTINTIWWTCSWPGGNPPSRCASQKMG
jgi:hypothetical protein